MRKNAAREAGVTLIELMTVLAIIGVLASIAIQSYAKYVMQSRRAQAQVHLFSLQLSQERWRANHSTYGTLPNIGPAPANPFYDFSVTQNTATDFTITASHKAGTSQVRDTDCQTMSVTQQGQSATNLLHAESAACWPK
ncbi:MAG: type IV pilus assembly protein PilE [Rhodoferax sp.]|jgi:type IV pilus assembly protein PilE